ncbi:hypothetical protein Pryu01_00815 [Paraliobacillus ryukyuensis]|uniref:O-antigen ligase-like membrane protein n=1 Tax=Paraliobacillus ryukyuensis TaxID=200904 RepID=A0A366EE00_9BACI|nr:hypothetical protein [Paraliobacillus ryukyuensis]RBP00612.1 hypothetical protein DES48_102377 [Paraliobacillus ryukyuensis]
MQLKINKNNLVLFVILSTMILPIMNFFGFGIPVIYLLTPLGIGILMLIMFGRVKIPRIVKVLLVIWFMILFQIVVTTLYSTVNKLGYFVFPTDITQYVVRFVFLVSFIVIAYKGYIDKDKFINYFLIVLIMGMSIGILQWLPWIGREFLTNVYPFKDGIDQLKNLDRPLHLIRIHGFAQHATGNGGIASFALVFGYCVKKYYKKYNILSLILIMMSVINIFISQARAGMLAAIFSIFLLYVVNIKYEKKGLKSTIYMLTLISILALVVYYLYNSGNPYVVLAYDRWLNLFETGGGARATTQPQYFFSMMESADYFFGLSKPIINRSLISYGIEIEPLNIFVTYGLVGFIFHYTLVAFLLMYFYKKISKKVEDKATLTLIIASFVGLFGYQIFSVAYFFFREIRIGLFPWVLMGVGIGLYERYKLKGLSNKSKEIKLNNKGNSL